MKKYPLLLVVILLFPVCGFSLTSFTYFPLNQVGSNSEYDFLSKSIPRSIKVTVSSDERKTVNHNNEQIVDPTKRELILGIGNRLNTDIIICGNYTVTGQGLGEKIELEIYVYDIKGGELVIQKKIIGGTGAAIFTMIDETAGIIKTQ